MKKIKRIRKAYKIYGEDQGVAFMSLLYTYSVGENRLVAEGKGKKAISEYRTYFNRYICDRYGRDFFDEFSLFCMNNQFNKGL